MHMQGLGLFDSESGPEMLFQKIRSPFDSEPDSESNSESRGLASFMFRIYVSYKSKRSTKEHADMSRYVCHDTHVTICMLL